MVEYDKKDISTLIHELRSPLSALVGIVEQAKLGLNSKEEVEDAFNQIESLSSYVLSLSNNLLEISKNENFSFKTSEETIFSLRDVIGYVISVFSFQMKIKEINFENKIDYPSFLLFGNPLKLKQILINLLSNSFKYTATKGSVWLGCKYEKIGTEIKLEITVKDTGIGMSKNYLEKIFTPYNQESSEIISRGTGLGLYIVRDNIIAMKGAIKIDSIKGQGTTILCTIPLKIRELDCDFSEKRILIIEDCLITQSVLKTYLEKTKVNLDFYTDGLTGLKAFSESAIGYYQLILVDNKLPGISGAALTKNIRELARKDVQDIPIICLSASSYTYDMNQCLEAGMNDYLVKPCSKDKLLYTLSKYI